MSFWYLQIDQKTTENFVRISALEGKSKKAPNKSFLNNFKK